MQNHAESADLRQTTKIVIAGGGGRACVRACGTNLVKLFNLTEGLRALEETMLRSGFLQEQIRAGG